MSLTTINDSLSLLGWGGLFHVGPISDDGLDTIDDRLHLLGHLRHNFPTPDGEINIPDPEDQDQSGADDAFLATFGIYPVRKCFRVGARPDNAKGWSELGGLQWIHPEFGVNMFSVTDDLGRKVDLMFDEDTGLPFYIASRTNPIAGGLARFYKDKYLSNYENGSEIPFFVLPREHLAKREHAEISHMESHVYIRPQDEGNKNRDGYKKNGLRAEQELSIVLYKDGNLVEDARARNIPNLADIVFDEKMQATRIQIGIRGTASEIKIGGLTTYYEELDQRGWPDERVLTEASIQEALAVPLFWVSRGDPMLQDKATGEFPEGSIFGYTEGPDGDPTSALLLAPASSLEWPWNRSLFPGYTIMFSIKSVTAPVRIIEWSDGGYAQIIIQEDRFRLQFFDGVTAYIVDLNWSGKDWGMLKIVNDAGMMKFYLNKVLLNSSAAPFGSYLSGSTISVPGDLMKVLFDLRIYESVISVDEYDYYHDNVINHKGLAVLCL